MTDRWATFDCYGTLIDWNGGIRRELARVFGDEHGRELLAYRVPSERCSATAGPPSTATAR